MVTQITSEGIAGTNVIIAPDGTTSAIFNSNTLDATLGPAVGAIAVRGSSAWAALPPGVAGNLLQTNGANTAPSWVAVTNSLNSGAVDAAFGSAAGSMLVRGATVWQSLVVGASVNSLITNSGGTPTWQTLSAFMDAAFSSTQGAVLYRGAGVWSALAPGTAGQFLSSGGAAANPSWVSPAGAGTVTSVALTAPSFITVTGSPITTTGTLALTLANQTANTHLAGPTSGGAAAPTFRALVAADIPTAAALDNIGATQGSVLYRSATAWSALGPGTSGQVLQSGGAAANPSWVAQSGGTGFASGTAMLFQQTAAPTGWTKQTTHNDKLLRVVSGTASSGGTNAFSTINAQTVVGSTTISTATMPSHNHGYTDASGSNCTYDGSLFGGFNLFDLASAGTSGATGSGGSHNHTISMAIQYVDLIIATAN